MSNHFTPENITELQPNEVSQPGERGCATQWIDGLPRLDGDATNPNPDHERLKQQPRNPVADQPRQSGRCNAPCGFNAFPTQPPICGRDDGISSELDGITFSKWRMQSIKGYGNAIVPQVAYHIFEAINEFELLTK